MLLNKISAQISQGLAEPGAAHTEEECSKPSRVPQEEPAMLCEDGSIPSRVVCYHSQNERRSIRERSSSESGEEDKIFAEYAGTGESLDQV